MTFGQLLKAARERANLGVSAAAEKAGVAFGYWYELERDEASPTLVKLELIAHAVGCNPRDLVPDDEPSGAVLTNSGP